jgi:LytS/YehU family sensor histidine kinase
MINPFREFLGVKTKIVNPFYSFLGGLRGSLTVSGFAVAIKLLKQWYVKKAEAEHFEREKLKAELELLKGHLHPHFMFNTLNSIYAMALKNAPQTPDAILKLSNLMRYMITECKEPAIDLAKEIQILTTYMELEKSRLGERLDQVWDIRGDLNNKKIAPLLLLPFIENSFKHGAYMATEQGWLSMEIVIAESELSFRLINGKNGFAGSEPMGTGTGLSNVKKRLALLYPESHELRITEDDETYIVSLKLSLDRIVLPAA